MENDLKAAQQLLKRNVVLVTEYFQKAKNILFVSWE